MTSISGVGASGVQSSVYGGGGGVSAPGGAAQGDSSILEYDKMPSDVEDYVKTAHREFLQRRGDLQRQLAEADDPEKQRQIKEQIDRLDQSFEAFQQEVAAGLQDPNTAVPSQMHGVDPGGPGPGEGDGVERVGPGPKNGDGVEGAGPEGVRRPGADSVDEAASDGGVDRLEGPVGAGRVSEVVSDFVEELQSGYNPAETQRVDPPAMENAASDVEPADFERAREALEGSDAAASNLGARDRTRLDDMLGLMEELSPRDASDKQREEIRG